MTPEERALYRELWSRHMECVPLTAEEVAIYADLSERYMIELIKRVIAGRDSEG